MENYDAVYIKILDQSNLLRTVLYTYLKIYTIKFILQDVYC